MSGVTKHISGAKVSVIIPVYNCQEYLKECLESVVRQTYTDLEVLLVNDGSTDGSLDILKQYVNRDSRFSITNTTNKGVSAARNRALSAARGEYIIFVDADDYLLNDDAIAKLHKGLSKDVDLVVSNGFLESSRHDNFPKSNSIARSNFDEYLVDAIPYEQLNSVCGKLYRADKIRSNGIKFDSSLKMGEDLLFNINYLETCGALHILNDTLYFYRTTNSKSATSSFLQDKYKDLMFVCREMNKWAARYNNKRLTDACRYIRFKNVLSAINNLNHKDCKISTRQKIHKSMLYKSENPRIIVRGRGLKIYLASIAYSFLPAPTIYFGLKFAYGKNR